MVKVMEEGLRLVVMEGRRGTDYLKQILEVQKLPPLESQVWTREEDLVTLLSRQM